MILAYYGYGYYYFDPTYIFLIIGAAICMIASARVNSTYNKYSNYRSMSGLTGAQAAERGNYRCSDSSYKRQSDR